MNIQETIKSIIDNGTWTQARLARHLEKSPQSIHERLANKKDASMSIDNAIAMLEPLGYDVVVVPKGVDRMPQGSFVIEPSKRG